MNGNNLSRYEDIRTLADRVVNSALMKITNTERRTKNLGSSTRVERSRVIQHLRLVRLVINKSYGYINHIYGEEAQRYDVDKECRLWRETLDEASFIDTTCRPMVNQFDVEEIQVAADVIHLNVLVKDLGGIFI
nr:12717_t:CDS:2 [Entrophospora candida]